MPKTLGVRRTGDRGVCCSLTSNSGKDQGEVSNASNIAPNVKRKPTSVASAEEQEFWENTAFLRSDRAVHVDLGNVCCTHTTHRWLP